MGGGGENKMEGWIFVSIYKFIVFPSSPPHTHTQTHFLPSLNKGEEGRDEDFQMRSYRRGGIFFVKIGGGGGSL